MFVFHCTVGENATFTPHPPPLEAPSPQGEGLGAPAPEVFDSLGRPMGGCFLFDGGQSN